MVMGRCLSIIAAVCGLAVAAHAQVIGPRHAPDFNTYTARWAFDSTNAAGNWIDSSGNNRTLTNAALRQITESTRYGDVNYSVRADGVDDYGVYGGLDATNFALYRNGTGLSVTVSCWINRDYTINFVSQSIASQPNLMFGPHWSILVNSVPMAGFSNRLSWSCVPNGLDTAFEVTMTNYTALWPTGQWFHVACQVEGYGTNLTNAAVWINGAKPLQSVRYGGLGGSYPPPGISTQPVYVAATFASGSVQLPFPGKIDGFRFAPAYLSSNEINYLMLITHPSNKFTRY